MEERVISFMDYASQSFNIFLWVIIFGIYLGISLSLLSQIRYLYNKQNVLMIGLGFVLAGGLTYGSYWLLTKGF